MNFHGPIVERSPAADFAPPSTFTRTPRPSRKSHARQIGLLGVLLVHGIMALLYFTVHSTFDVMKEQRVAVIDLPPELPEEVKPPPPPKFTPPEVYVATPIIPLLTLEDPPPTPKAITVPPAPITNAAPNAPLVQAAVVAFDGDARAAYVGALMKHLNRFKQYPQSAKLRHEQGVVSLRFTIDRTGHVLASSITRSSGSKALDAEVLDAVRRADPLPRIPDIFGREQLDLVVPVEFVLN